MAYTILLRPAAERDRRLRTSLPRHREGRPRGDESLLGRDGRAEDVGSADPGPLATPEEAADPADQGAEEAAEPASASA